MKAFRIQLEVALEKIQKATRLAGSITSAEEWKEFDKTCVEADCLIFDALTCVALKDLVPESDEKKLISALRQLQVDRIEVYVNWNMLWREQEAIRDPKGKYGIMRARRLKMEAEIEREQKARLN